MLTCLPQTLKCRIGGIGTVIEPKSLGINQKNQFDVCWRVTGSEPLQSSDLKLRQGQGPRAVKTTHRNSYLCSLDLHGSAHSLRFSFLNLVCTAVVTSNRYKFGVCYADRAGTPMGPTMEIKLPIKSVCHQPCPEEPGAAWHSTQPPALPTRTPPAESPSFSQHAARTCCCCSVSSSQMSGSLLVAQQCGFRL